MRISEMSRDWRDAAYSMGFCYEELGDYGKAAETWENIAGHLEERGFEAEVNWPRKRARECADKM